MGNSQLYAKIGVFALLGINVAAYYFFWPKQIGVVKESKIAKEDRGEAQLLPPPMLKPAELPKPKELTADFRQDAMPLQVPEPMKTPDDEMIRKLLEQIDRDKAGTPPPTKWANEKKDVFAEKQANPANEIRFPPILPLDKPRTLPKLQGDPIDPAKVGVTSPLTPKVPTAVWYLYQEPAGKQTMLVGKLQPVATSPPVAEFRILCDRIETKSAANEVVAVGNVAFSGAGLRGECQRVTLPLLEPIVIFDDHVRIEQESGLGPLRGERILWGPVSLPTNQPSTARPAVLWPPK